MTKATGAKERLRKYLKHIGISENKFYTTTGLSNGYLNSGSGINTDKLEIIIYNYPDLNLYYLAISEDYPMTVNIDDVQESVGSNGDHFRKVSMAQLVQMIEDLRAEIDALKNKK